MSFVEVALALFRLFLLIGPFGRLEHLICESLESVTMSGIVLSLGMENADVIKEAFKFTWFVSVLFIASWPLHRVDKIIRFPLLVVALG
jgi:predicted benzoate:H+ symporter BenE